LLTGGAYAPDATCIATPLTGVLCVFRNGRRTDAKKSNSDSDSESTLYISSSVRYCYVSSFTIFISGAVRQSMLDIRQL